MADLNIFIPAPLIAERIVNVDLSDQLDGYLMQSFGWPYQDGVHDCALFCARWIDQVCGSDTYGQHVGQYQSKMEGVRKFGMPSERVRQCITDLGWTRAGNLRTGDIVLTDLDTAGIWDGDAIVMQATPASGHAYLHSRHVKEVWRWDR